MLGCQIRKQFQLRQWWDCNSHISNSCRLSYTTRRKIKTCSRHDERCRHVVSGCSALVQILYLTRHNAALKVLSGFEMLRGYSRGCHPTLVFTSPAQSCVPRRQGDGVLACACVRGAQGFCKGSCQYMKQLSAIVYEVARLYWYSIKN